MGSVHGGEVYPLTYADDIVLLSGSMPNAQKQLDIMASWCDKWSIWINTKKFQIHLESVNCSIPDFQITHVFS